MFGLNVENNKKIQNDISNRNNFQKQWADKYTELYAIYEKEKDPIRKSKMQNRLALGILDFSDL